MHDKNTVLASEGTRSGPVLALPTVSVFLIHKWGVGGGSDELWSLNSPLKLLNSDILPTQHVPFSVPF